MADDLEVIVVQRQVDGVWDVSCFNRVCGSSGLHGVGESESKGKAEAMARRHRLEISRAIAGGAKPINPPTVIRIDTPHPPNEDVSEPWRAYAARWRERAETAERQVTTCEAGIDHLEKRVAYLEQRAAKAEERNARVRELAHTLRTEAEQGEQNANIDSLRAGWKTQAHIAGIFLAALDSQEAASVPPETSATEEET